jgi:hypothetical protein
VWQAGGKPGYFPSKLVYLGVENRVGSRLKELSSACPVIVILGSYFMIIKAQGRIQLIGHTLQTPVIVTRELYHIRQVSKPLFNISFGISFCRTELMFFKIGKSAHYRFTN